MYKIQKAEKLADKIYLMDVEAPRVARHCQPGQFIIVKMDEKGERIPLTICDFDREKGIVTIVFQTVGASTEKMAHLKAGDAFEDFVGPLGCPSELIGEDIEELKKEKESTKKPDKKDESYETDDNKRLIDLCIRLVGKTYLVTTDNAKIYEEPSNKSEVISSIPMGSEVYIYEAKPDSGQRVWCHAIIKSADSLKSYDAWISSNNLEIND